MAYVWDDIKPSLTCLLEMCTPALHFHLLTKQFCSFTIIMRSFALVSSIVALAATFGSQQFGVFAAPASALNPILQNGTVADLVNTVLKSRALTGEFIGFHGTNAVCTP